MRHKTLIFDLDGTVSDPLVGISRSINHALNSLSYEQVSVETIQSLIGVPLADIFNRIQSDISQSQVLELVAKYRERYSNIGYGENTIYENMYDVVKQLSVSGYQLGVCTSKRADYANKIVKMFGLTDCFSFVSGGDIDVEKSEQLAELVASGIESESAVMIGDRSIDIAAAKANNMQSAGVSWGFGSQLEIENAGPDYIAHHPKDLLTLFV